MSIKFFCVFFFIGIKEYDVLGINARIVLGILKKLICFRIIIAFSFNKAAYFSMHDAYHMET